MRRLLLAALFASTPWLAHAKLVTRDVEYTVDKQAMHGYLAYDDGAKAQRPGVLVVSEGARVDEATMRRARDLAQSGFVAFAVAMQGAAPAQGLALALRAKAALDTVRQQPQTDPERLAAVGFGLGGTAVLQLAYAGAHMRAVASVDGALTPPDADQGRRIRCAMLVLDLAGIAAAHPDAFDEMRKALAPVHVDAAFATYGRAQHAKDERRAWGTLRGFLAETLR